MTNINLDTLTQEELRDLQERISEVLAGTPAEPLSNPLNVGDTYWFVSTSGQIKKDEWENHEVDHVRQYEKNVFPDNPSGKLGAELRAKIPHPGIHWQEDVRKLAEWAEDVTWTGGSIEGMCLLDFLLKYS